MAAGQVAPVGSRPGAPVGSRPGAPVAAGQVPRCGTETDLLDDVLGYLRCPHCGRPLAQAGPALRCAAGHSFDIARQGYVSLLPAGIPGDAGDTAAMVRARRDFLAAGHFAPIAAALTRAPGTGITPRAARAIPPGPGPVAGSRAGVGAPEPEDLRPRGARAAGEKVHEDHISRAGSTLVDRVEAVRANSKERQCNDHRGKGAGQNREGASGPSRQGRGHH